MGDDNVGHCEWGDRMNMCLILSVYRDKLFEYADLTPSGFLFAGLDGERSFVDESWIHETNYSPTI